MQLDLVEPLRDLFKDEVRRMGTELGIPNEMLDRHPFPGPGLGVRIIGEITKEKTKMVVIKHLKPVTNIDVLVRIR